MGVVVAVFVVDLGAFWGGPPIGLKKPLSIARMVAIKDGKRSLGSIAVPKMLTGRDPVLWPVGRPWISSWVAMASGRL